MLCLSPVLISMASINGCFGRFWIYLANSEFMVLRLSLFRKALTYWLNRSVLVSGLSTVVDFWRLSSTPFRTVSIVV